MIEKVLRGKLTYWRWFIFLSVFITIGAICSCRQFLLGLGLTGMGRGSVLGEMHISIYLSRWRCSRWIDARLSLLHSRLATCKTIFSP